MTKVKCLNLMGNEVWVEQTELIPRPAVYGLIFNSSGELLVEDTRDQTGKFWFLGGKMEKDESEEQTLLRELNEEVSIQVYNISLFMRSEFNFFYEPTKKAFCCYSSFYKCTTDQLKIAGNVKSKWLNLSEILPSDFHPLVQNVIVELQK